MIRPELLTGAIITLAVVAAAVRLALWRRRVGEDEQASWGRIAALIGLAIAAGVLLYLTLFPPPSRFAPGTLVVATAGAPRGLTAQPGERLIALLEAPPVAAAERVPDLATATRRDGRPERLRIVGAGLTSRDRPAAAGVPLDFRSPPVPRGLIDLEPPPATAAGSAFAIGGRTNGLVGATAELLDPAGRRIDARRVGSDGRFVLVGTARTPGMALFTLRIRDAARAVAVESAVPLWIVVEAKLRVLVIGAPGPETKYLRRWAADAGIELQSQLEAGGGVRLGDAPIALTSAALRRFDAVIIDDRNWQALGGRGALADAVTSGLGLVVRMTGPATPAMRRDLRALGLAVAGGDALKPIALVPLAIDADALAAQRGPASPDEAIAESTLDDPAPELGRWDIRAVADAIPLLRDAGGEPLVVWRTRGLGRAALWAVADSYALVLAGQRERHFQWWSDAVTLVARAEPEFAPDLPAIVRAGERMTICGVAGQPRIVAPGGSETMLALADPAGAPGCAAYWPVRTGPHTLIQPARDGVRSRPFHVYPADALPAIAAFERRQVTLALAVSSRTADARAAPGERPGSAWPWFLSWLAVSAMLWALERRRPSISASSIRAPNR